MTIGFDSTSVLPFKSFHSDVANVAVACLHNVRDTMPYDNVYGFEQNLRVENAASPPHTPPQIVLAQCGKR